MIASIIARLKEAGTPFRIVGGAAELADVKDHPPALPAAYAYEARERSAETELINDVFQRTEVDISVVIVTGNLSKANNAAAADDLTNLKIFVRGQLLGFMPAGAENPLMHVEGELQQAVGGTVWFEDVFITAYYQESQP